MVFTTPMPTGFYCAISTPTSTARTARILNRLTTGFTVNIQKTVDQELTDSTFCVTVNATNATLPTTFTEAQIQSVIDAQPQGIAKAWGNFNGIGTIAYRKSFNVGALTDNGSGDYTVTLSPPMPDANYVVLLTFSDNGSTNVAKVNENTITASSFEINIGAYQAGTTDNPQNAPYVYFAVYSD